MMTTQPGPEICPSMMTVNGNLSCNHVSFKYSSEANLFFHSHPKAAFANHQDTYVEVNLSYAIS
jgi:hypothetical protein